MLQKISCAKIKASKEIMLNIFGEINHFNTYIMENYSDKVYFCHQKMYLINKNNTHLAFPYIEAIQQIFLSLMVTNCSQE